jgi:predicted protein tyrosine phosphatase
MLLRKLRILFVCSANLQRSPTAEEVFGNFSDEWQTKSAGIMPSSGRNSLTQKLVNWADLILVMEPEHAEYIQDNYSSNSDKIRILNIPDVYVRNDPELIQELKKKALPIIENWNPRSKL